MSDRAGYEKLSGRDRFFRLLNHEIDSIIDPETGLLKESLAESVTCYVCGGTEERTIFVKSGLRFVSCERCGLIFMNPRVSATALEQLYEFDSKANDAWVDVLLSDAEEKFQTYDFGSLLDELGDRQGRLLDVGCSIGRLLNLARARGYDVLGLELGARAARHAREQYGLPVIEKTLEESQLESASFDVVTMIEVLEHLPDPRSALTEIHRILKEGGLLLIGVPNAWSLGVLVLGEAARTFNRNHLAYYNERTLTQLLTQKGFRLVKAMTAVPLLDSILNHLQMLDPFGPPETRFLPPSIRERVESPAERQQIEGSILQSGLGYRLRVIAERV